MSGQAVRATITYAVLTKDEAEPVDRLLGILAAALGDADRIQVIDDESGRETRDVLDRHQRADDRVAWASRPLAGDFAAQRNHAMDIATTDWVLFIDADEVPHPSLLPKLPGFLARHMDWDIFVLPRVNTVDDPADPVIGRLGWSVDAEGRINFPDYQTRGLRNLPHVRWHGRVHEKAQGRNRLFAPARNDWALLHHKTNARVLETLRRYRPIVQEVSGR